MNDGADVKDRTATILGAVVAFAVIATVIFVVVGAEEWTYASDHPYAYGPAKIIAWGAGAGTILSVAVALLAYAVRRELLTGSRRWPD